MTTRTVDSRASLKSRMPAAATMIGCVTISLLYFGDLFLKASRKCFWYDELFTVYLCRLPDFRHTWNAVTQGADENPPFLYLLTRGVERIFGEGLIATRLPEMVGVWIFGVCLYLFVSRRVGRIPGLIAGHRDTYFRPLRGIKKGMKINVIDATGIYHYALDAMEVVPPEQVSVLAIRSRPGLVLITCYPFFYIGAAPKRFIVYAHLLSVDPDTRSD